MRSWCSSVARQRTLTSTDPLSMQHATPESEFSDRLWRSSWLFRANVLHFHAAFAPLRSGASSIHAVSDERSIAAAWDVHEAQRLGARCRTFANPNAHAADRALSDSVRFSTGCHSSLDGRSDAPGIERATSPWIAMWIQSRLHAASRLFRGRRESKPSLPAGIRTATNARAVTLLAGLSTLSACTTSYPPVQSPHADPLRTASSTPGVREMPTIVVAGYTLQLTGLGALTTGVVLGVRQDGSDRSSGAWVALGGAASVLVGTLLLARTSPRGAGPIEAQNEGAMPSSSPTAGVSRSRSKRAAAMGDQRNGRSAFTEASHLE